jgi:hypothetical protein
MLKSLYTISHFAMLCGYNGFSCIIFWRFIFIPYISYAAKKKKKKNTYQMGLKSL